MAQPFGVGDVVGGRYRITHHVVTSADQDIVFQASDEVLDRDVSILLASRSNAKQVATSARELAMGSRDSDVQVLDLGLAEERTYLISSLVDPNTLLDLVVPDTAPYVEPFFTDSLGSELFGQSRIMEPETYEDDDEYYAGLHAGSAEDRSEDPARRFRRRRPAFLDKVSDSLNRRLNTENDAAAHAVAAGQADQGQADQGQADQGRAAAAAYLLSDMEVTSADPAADTAEDFSGTRESFTAASAESFEGREPTAPEEDRSSAPTEAGADAASGDSEGFAPQDSYPDQPAPAQDAERLDGDEVVDDPPDSFVEDEDLPLAPAAPALAPLPGPARSRGLSDAVSFTGLIRPVPRLEDDAALQAPSSAAAPELHSSSPARTGHSGSEGPVAAGLSGAAAETTAAEPADTDFQDEKPGIGRWITAAVLAAVLLVAAVVMFMNLRGGETQDASDQQDQEEGAGDAGAEESGDEGTEEGDQEPGTEESAPTEAESVEPEIANITRVVPDSPDLISDRDGQLANLLDGDPATTWVTLSFATADFGGFSSGVGLVAELQEPAELSAVTVTQEGDSSGGSFEILVNDTPSFEGAEQVGSGTLNWNETTVEVESEGEVGYVILNITELPSQATPNADGLPFSAELAEISLD
ncbi:hypothetical protein I2485_04945 [Nesterenkonia sp. E16_7]|uniref:hypothetical protein n=1 Tax=unclassified Nesterenkonia TaxID=2629769 RepID=UPI001A92762A|nr:MULTISPECIES: hypothetical protein [unclassified Nesterenkonia]MBO0596614.1 hypothetical protein [Nesterenkonia sp. E16_10]MBO0597994.1 hypothetical protein [Nesterenkonia sp. E16_7]